MILEVEISDAIYKKYKAHSPKDPKAAIEANIKKFSTVGTQDRVVLLESKERDEVEVLLERHLGGPGELVACLKDALKVRVDGVEIVPNPDILGLLKQQADFDGREYKEFIKDKLAQALGIAAQGF